MAIEVKAGQSINAAILANPGAELILEAGVTFTESVRLSDRGGSLKGGAGTKVASPNGAAAIFGHSAKGWALSDFELLPNVGGTGNVVELQGASQIAFDRLAFTGGTSGQRRVICGNGRDIAVRRCNFKNVWRVGEESCGFGAWNGAGPYILEDNDFEVAGINVLFGGANSASAADIPADITVRNNRFTKNLAWKGTTKVVKNLFELKQAKRALIENNLFENNWGAQGQSGYGILFTAVNDDKGSPWACVEDILFQNNILRNSARGIQISGHDPYAVSSGVTRVRILDNDLGITDWLFSIGNNAGEIEVGRNTASNTGFKAFFYAGATKGADGVTWVNWPYAVEKLIWYDNAVQGSFRGDSPDSKWEPFVKEFIDVAPAPIPEPEPEPEGPTELELLTARVTTLEMKVAECEASRLTTQSAIDALAARIAEIKAHLRSTP